MGNNRLRFLTHWGHLSDGIRVLLRRAPTWSCGVYLGAGLFNERARSETLSLPHRVANLDRGRFTNLAHSFVSITSFLRLEPKGPEFGEYAKTFDRNISYTMDVHISERKGKKETRLYRAFVIHAQSTSSENPTWDKHTHSWQIFTCVLQHVSPVKNALRFYTRLTYL